VGVEEEELDGELVVLSVVGDVVGEMDEGVDGAWVCPKLGTRVVGAFVGVILGALVIGSGVMGDFVGVTEVGADVSSGVVGAELVGVALGPAVTGADVVGS